MTVYQRTGISIVAATSIFTSPQLAVGSYTGQIAGYSHQIDADGGYRKATITLALSQPEAEDWFEYGLMRDITVYNAAGLVIWNGFVNKVGLSAGGLKIDRGPVLDIVNRVSVVYTRLDISVDPPVAGGESTTVIAENAASQALYGALETVLSGGTCTDADAEQLRDSYLAERCQPTVTQSFDLAGNAGPTVTIECCGYVEYLGKFIYDSTATTTCTISAKVWAVLMARPNGVVSTDLTEIGTNAYLVPVGDAKAQPGMDILRGLVALGDAWENRWTLGLYAGRKARYQQAPTSFAYQGTLRSAQVGLYGGGPVNPWDVLPARWIFYNDFLVGRGAPASNLRVDPRAQFIESVTYTAPYGLSLAGGKTEKLAQKMAQYGLGGA